MRIATRVLTALLAATIAAGAMYLVAEIVVALIGQAPMGVDWRGWYDTAQTAGWDQSIVRTLAIVAIVAGVVLATIALWPRPRVTIPAGEDAAVRLAVRRTAVEDELARAVERVDDVHTDGVRYRRGRVRIDAHTSRRLADLAALKTTATDAATRRLRDLDVDGVRVDVRVQPTRPPLQTTGA